MVMLASWNICIKLEKPKIEATSLVVPDLKIRDPSSQLRVYILNYPKLILVDNISNQATMKELKDCAVLNILLNISMS